MPGLFSSVLSPVKQQKFGALANSTDLTSTVGTKVFYNSPLIYRFLLFFKASMEVQRKKKQNRWL